MNIIDGGKKDKKIESLKEIIEEKDQNIADLDQQNQELMQESLVQNHKKERSDSRR